MKRIILALAIILTFGISNAQTRYYIVPSDSVASWTPLMGQTIGHSNINIRCSIGGTLCLMKFDVGIAPTGSGIAYTVEQIRDIVQTATWNSSSPTPITSTLRIDKAREKGYELTNAWFARIDSMHDAGTWSLGQAGGILINYYDDLFVPIREGLFNLVLSGFTAGQYTPAGVVTQGHLDAIENKLQEWEDENPRP